MIFRITFDFITQLILTVYNTYLLICYMQQQFSKTQLILNPDKCFMKNYTANLFFGYLSNNDISILFHQHNESEPNGRGRAITSCSSLFSQQLKISKIEKFIKLTNLIAVEFDCREILLQVTKLIPLGVFLNYQQPQISHDHLQSSVIFHQSGTFIVHILITVVFPTSVAPGPLCYFVQCQLSVLRIVLYIKIIYLFKVKL